MLGLQLFYTEFGAITALPGEEAGLALQGRALLRRVEEASHHFGRRNLLDLVREPGRTCLLKAQTPSFLFSLEISGAG